MGCRALSGHPVAKALESKLASRPCAGGLPACRHLRQWPEAGGETHTRQPGSPLAARILGAQPGSLLPASRVVPHRQEGRQTGPDLGARWGLHSPPAHRRHTACCGPAPWQGFGQGTLGTHAQQRRRERVSPAAAQVGAEVPRGRCEGRARCGGMSWRG